MNALLPPPGSIIGVVHLLPLPGAPSPGPGAAAVVDRALRDAEALVNGGAAACIVENYGDLPFAAGPAEPHVVAWMTRVAAEIETRFGSRLQVGVNVLRNAPCDALAVAAASGASFIRVNVHVGAVVTDQGLIEGEARKTLLYRRRLEAACAIVADVRVKHGMPLAATSVAQEAADAFHRGLADALVVTGPATGTPCDPDRLREVRGAVPEAPLWLGSGLTADNAAFYRPLCDAAIVGTWLHGHGRIGEALEPERIRRLVAAFAG
jgi:uncharacterized protein